MLIEINCVQNLLVWVKAPGSRGFEANQLKRQHSEEGRQEARLLFLFIVKEDYKVNLRGIDSRKKVWQISQDDGRSPTLLDLKHIAKHLGEVLVVEDQKDN